MIYIQDHEDSFTFNIAEFFSYANKPVKVLSYDKYITIDQLVSDDLLILGPGPGIPSDYSQLMEILHQNIPCPVIGICLGAQAMGLALGGKLIQASPNFGTIENLVIRDISTNYQYCRYHSWQIEIPQPNHDVEIISVSSRDNSIQMFEVSQKKWLAIQFHPESIGSTVPLKFFLDLVNNLQTNSTK